MQKVLGDLQHGRISIEETSKLLGTDMRLQRPVAESRRHARPQRRYADDDDSDDAEEEEAPRRKRRAELPLRRAYRELIDDGNDGMFGSCNLCCSPIRGCFRVIINCVVLFIGCMILLVAFGWVMKIFIAIWPYL